VRLPFRLALGEWQHLMRTRLAVAVILMLLGLTAVAAGNSAYQIASEARVAAAYQHEAEEAFRNQPARHPHRVVHYGHYVFRGPPPLAAVDPGVDPFTGRSIFLEGHRRNTATFAEARETSVLTRLGAVSPAFMLQVIAPLLLILVGFNSVVRERERGTWVQLLALGVRPGQLILGKALAIGGVAMLVLTPLLVAVLWLAFRHPGEVLPGLVMLGGHALYLGCWVLLIVAVSAWIKQSRSALISLMIIWAGTTVLMPRIAADVAATVVPSWTQTEMDILVQRDMRTVGDSHNINDPGFQTFQQRVLAEYGVDRVEDLPVNYRGLVSYQGEAEGSAVKNRYAAQLHGLQRRQAEVIQWFSLLSPYVAVRNLSMRTAGTDLVNHQRFLDAAEAHRYALIQELNLLHVHELRWEDDTARSVDFAAESRTRIDPQFWQRLMSFSFTPSPAVERITSALPLLLMLALWVGLAVAALRYVSIKAGET
jgi:ABC-2 type transport system permease protein